MGVFKMVEYITAEETAKLLRCSVATIRRRARALGGTKLPGCRPWLFPRKEIEKRLAK